MPHKMTIEKTIEALKKAVAEKGEDYVYKENEEIGWCLYSDRESGQPSCIVGHVLADLDPEAFARVRAWELRSARSAGVSTTIFQRVALPDISPVDRPLILALLGDVQNQQDDGVAWGPALAESLALIGRDA